MTSSRLLALFVCVLGACLAIAAPAAAQAPFDSPGDTGSIELVGSATSGDFAFDLYRNLAYPCSISGYQTFAVGTRLGSSPTEPGPLWVRMRGGGVGFFDPAGEPQPSDGAKTESDLPELLRFVEENELNALVNSDPAGFRVVSVSMCDHDIYGGGDQLDPNNPNLTPDGQPRTVNGLFATKAAIEFVQDSYPTTKTFLHGTSAGSYGTYGVAWSLERQDRPVAGVVADAGVLNLQSELDQNAAQTPCARGPELLAIVAQRLHPAIADPANQPESLLARGALTAPIYNIWNRYDSNSCGPIPIQCTLADGSVVTLGGMECRMQRVASAIEALPPSRRSVNARVCVADKRGDQCERHVVTNASSTEFPNTDPSTPADFNGAIIDWVHQRLADRAPELDVGFGKAAKLRVKGRRTEIRCESGGYEQRRCTVELRTRGGRKLGSGRRSIQPDADGRKVMVKLNGRGRRLLADAPRNGLRVRARAEVSERYTDRRGQRSRGLRLRLR